MKLSRRELTALLLQALSASIGVKVFTNNPNLLRQKLYALRREDSTYNVLSFIISPTDPESHLFIIRKTEPENAED